MSRIWRKIWWMILIPLLYTVHINASYADITAPISHIINTSWIEQKVLKYGMVGSLCAAQSFTGLTEGYHWGRHSGYGGEHIVNSSNYHTYETLRRVSWISAGWFGYANIRDADIGWIGKGKRILGSALMSRNMFEWSYKFQRYNNPFDYTPAHNRHSVVYFGIRNGGIVDLYIGTGNVTTPIVDMICLTLGIILLNE